MRTKIDAHDSIAGLRSAETGECTQQRKLWIACVAEDFKTLSVTLLPLYIISAACQKDPHVQHCMILQQFLIFEPNNFVWTRHVCSRSRSQLAGWSACFLVGPVFDIGMYCNFG